MLIIAFDYETHTFGPANMTPAPVCLSYAVARVNPALACGFEVGENGVLPCFGGRGVAVDAMARWVEMAANGEAILVGANTGYDVFASIVGAYKRGSKEGRELFRNWVKAYDRGTVADVLVRQKLIDLACGNYRKFGPYSLKQVVKRHTGVELEKGEDTWRMRYAELEWLEPSQYPLEAYQYSLDDSVYALQVWIMQEGRDREHLRFSRADERIARNFWAGADPLIDEANQMRGALVMLDISNYGLRADPRGVALFEEATQEAANEARELLVAGGLIRREYFVETEAVERYIRERGLEKHFREMQTREGKRLSLQNHALRATGDQALALVADWRELRALVSSKNHPDQARVNQAWECIYWLVSVGLARCDESRDTKAAAERQWRAYMEPWTLDPETRLTPREPPRTDSWKPWKQNAEGRWVGDPGHIPSSRECVALDKDACLLSQDSLLQTYAEYVGLNKTLSTDLKALRQGTTLPIHTHFETILETGRTSSSGPNCQNPPRKAGARECYTARDGCCYIDCDFPSLELSTLGQTCKWVLGFSVLLDVLKDKDVHLYTATNILHRPYEDLLAHKKDEAVSTARTLAKPAIFGVPGGLGKQKLADFSYKGYGLRLTIDEAANLIKVIKDTYLEIGPYFKWVESCRAADAHEVQLPDGTSKMEDRYNMVQPWSGRLRAGATYCAACNTSFQGLGADVAKLAGWYIFKACYGFSELGEDDPLFGCHVVHFIHDQYLVEVPYDGTYQGAVRASAAAYRVSELMDLAGVTVMPDTCMRVMPVLSKQWSKKSHELYWKNLGFDAKMGCDAMVVTDKLDETCARLPNGRPVLAMWDVWDRTRAARKKLESKVTPEKSLRELLVEDGWPVYCVDEALCAA